MSDLISRAAAIDALDEVSKHYTEKGRGWHPHVDLMIYAIKELPSAPQWIPCKERLPEANGRYLVTRGLNACGALWNRVYVANYSDLMGIKSEKIWWQGNVGKSDFERLDDVTAWMSLPDPWKGEEDDT